MRSARWMLSLEPPFKWWIASWLEPLQFLPLSRGRPFESLPGRPSPLAQMRWSCKKRWFLRARPFAFQRRSSPVRTSVLGGKSFEWVSDSSLQAASFAPRSWDYWPKQGWTLFRFGGVPGWRSFPRGMSWWLQGARLAPVRFMKATVPFFSVFWPICLLRPWTLGSSVMTGPYWVMRFTALLLRPMW